MLLNFNFKETFELLWVTFDNHEDYQKMISWEKEVIVNKLWDKVADDKKNILSEIITNNMSIDNDFFWTIPLNIINNEYKHILNKNKLTINNLFDNGITNKNIFMNSKQENWDKINIFLDFSYNEINPLSDRTNKILFDFISSVILWYNFNSVINYKIINISLYKEIDNNFTIYNFKSPFTNITEYIILLHFILDWIEFDTKLLSKILFKSNNKRVNKNIKELIKLEKINFTQFIKIIWVNKELILSQELWTLIYNLDLTTNLFDKDKNKYINELWINDYDDLFKVLYLYLYFNFK